MEKNSDKLILENQRLIMAALTCLPNLDNAMKNELRDQIKVIKKHIIDLEYEEMKKIKSND